MSIGSNAEADNNFELLKSEIVANPELMQSMHQLYGQEQIQIELCNSNETSKMLQQTQVSDVPLVGKGDGFSANSALQDSIHPDQLPYVGVGLDESQFQFQTQQRNLVKQQLNDFTVKFNLGQVLVGVLCSEE